MIDVANLKLCQQLWELSGWETSDWYDLDPDGRPEEYLATTEDKIDENNYIPAYSLGYLLRKLPNRTERIQDTVLLGRATDNKGWSIVYRDMTKIANTPEDAAAKLAIELFKKGILTRSTENG